MVDKLRGKYLFQKRGVYYFSKQIPKDVRQHYSQNRIVQSLKTKSVKDAFYQSQKSIRNNLIRLRKIQGEITPRRYVVEGKNLIIEGENHLFEYFKYFSILSIIIFAMIVNPLLNPIEIFLNYIYLVYN